MLLSLSFSVGHEDESDEDDSQCNEPLLLACKSGNLEIAFPARFSALFLLRGNRASAANERGGTLLAAVGAGKLELAEMLVSKGANLEAVRKDGAGLPLLGHRLAAGTAAQFGSHL
jgi:hypothetical protein